MKKSRELWWFLVPFVLLNMWSVVGPLLWSKAALGETVAFIGGENYLRLLLNDSVFWVGVGNALLAICLTGAVIGAVLGAVVFLLLRRIPLSRSWRYVAVFAAAVLITLSVWVAQVRLVPNGYNWLYFLDEQLSASGAVLLNALFLSNSNFREIKNY